MMFAAMLWWPGPVMCSRKGCFDRLRKRVDDLDAFDPLTRLQIFRHQPIAAGPSRGTYAGNGTGSG